MPSPALFYTGDSPINPVESMESVWLSLAQPSPGAGAECTERRRWKANLTLRVPGQLGSNINRLHGELCSALVSRKDGQRSREATEGASTRVHSSRNN